MDHLLYFLLAVAVFFSVVIFAAIFYFAIRYRRRSEAELPHADARRHGLEILWSVIPFGLTMVMFTWGASIFFTRAAPPDDAHQIYVVGKQWMWKLQHMEGQREINELHIPVGRAVKLTMTSEDVIHSFFVPAFRTKADVVPGRYTTIWFKPTKPGKYHLFCAEYCGTNHSAHDRLGLRDGAAGLPDLAERRRATGSLAANRREAFHRLRLRQLPQARRHAAAAPSASDLYGTHVQLADGGHVKADEAYIRESILQPAGQDRCRLSADHAHVPGPGNRRGRAAADRIHQVAGAARRPGRRRTARPLHAAAQTAEPIDI